MNSENKLSHKDTMSAEANTKSPHTEEKSSTNVSPKHAGTAADGMEETMRENHPTIQIPKTGVLESELAVKTFAVEEISSKDTYKDRSIQELINECPSEIFKQWIDSIKHQIRGKWVTGKHKKGDIIYITYIHEGAKMWNSIGVTLRNPGFIFDGEKWLCIALKTPLGPEIGVQKGWEEESEDKGNGIEEHKMIMKMIAKGKGVLNGILSFKMDGQMIGVTFVTGDRKRLVMETIISWGEYITDDSTVKTYPNLMFMIAKHYEKTDYMPVISTNGLAIIKGDMVYCVVTAICAELGIEIKPNTKVEYYYKDILKYIQRFEAVFLISSSRLSNYKEMSEKPFAILCEAIMPNNTHAFGGTVQTELASSANDPGVKAYAWYRGDDYFCLDNKTSYLLKKHKINEAGRIEIKSVEMIHEIMERIEKIINAPPEKREEEIKKFNEDFGFPPNTPFHPEGFILTMIINGKSVYCKLKSATYYLCHASIEKLLKCPEKMKKVMELPEHVKYWFPVVGQVKELQDSIDKLLPEFSSLVMKEFKIIVDQFIGILDKYKGTVYISKKQVTKEFIQFVENKKKDNPVFYGRMIAIASITKNSNNLYPRLLNDDSICSKDVASKQHVFNYLYKKILEKMNLKNTILETKTKEGNNHLYEFMKSLIIHNGKVDMLQSPFVEIIISLVRHQNDYNNSEPVSVSLAAAKPVSVSLDSTAEKVECMSVIPITSDALLKLLSCNYTFKLDELPAHIGDKLRLSKTWHITIDHRGEVDVMKKIYVKITGIGAHEDCSWLSVEISFDEGITWQSNKSTRGLKGVYHISLTFPTGKAWMVGGKAEEHGNNRLSFVEEKQTAIELFILPARKGSGFSMDNGLSRNHTNPVFDFDGTFAHVDLEKVKKYYPDQVETYGWLRCVDVLKECTEITPLARILLNQLPYHNGELILQIVTSRQFKGIIELNKQFNSIIQKKIYDETGLMVKVFFSTQVKRIYDKIEQGVDKYERSRMLSSENSIDPGSILFFEDNKGTIKGLSEMGCRTVDVSNLDNPIYI